MKGLLKIFSQKQTGKETKTMEFMCPICDTNYKSLNDLAKHNLGIHSSGNGSEIKPKSSLPPTEEDFRRAKQELQKQGQDKSKEQSAEHKAERKPLVLRYKWDGECDQCGGEVDTIEIPIEDRNSCVAYCPACKRQLQQVPVIPIDTQWSGISAKPLRK
jgi:hypothetical protein